jgi:hypothetical protein
MTARTISQRSTGGPGRVRILLAAVWMILSLTLGGLVTAEGRQTMSSGNVAADSLP